jgi:NAD(P)-dependent dehydrogenase (short-subunit alcohol dehydrogenase family)
MAQKVVLISGANRGIGRGLEVYLAKPHHTVIAANRDPTHASSQSLRSLSVGPGSRLLLVKVDASIESDAADAVAELTSGEDGVDHLDLVIANAGIANKYPKVSELKTEDFIAHLTPNVLGSIWLFQATLPLLYKSEAPTWVTIGSDAGCIQVRSSLLIFLFNKASLFSLGYIHCSHKTNLFSIVSFYKT